VKLGINGWRLRTKTGVARVLSNIMRYWTPEFVGGRFDAVTVYSPIPLASDLRIPDWIDRRIIGPDLPMLAWENTRLPMAVRDDVLLCPSFSRPLVTSARTVSLIYEATQKLFPKYYPFSARFIHTPLYGWSARNSTLVVTNTDQARADIISAYKAPPEKVRVVPLAPAEIFQPTYDGARIAEVRCRYAQGETPFFLYVGKLTARRNVPRIVEGLAEMKRLRPNAHKVVIVGLNTTNVDLGELSARLGVQDDVIHHSFVPDDDLAVLYSAAEAFVLPYSYESAASLTLLEAQAAGAPVITTDTIGLRQVAGNAALFLPDVESSTLADAMVRLASDFGLRQDISQRGVQNAARFSWQRCSKEVIEILHEAAGS